MVSEEVAPGSRRVARGASSNELEIHGFTRDHEETTEYGKSWAFSMLCGVERMIVTIEPLLAVTLADAERCPSATSQAGTRRARTKRRAPGNVRLGHPSSRRRRKLPTLPLPRRSITTGSPRRPTPGTL